MSSKKYAVPLQLEIKPSRILFVVLLLFHLSAIAILITLSMPAVITFVLSIVLILIGAHLVSLHALRSSEKAVTKIIWDANDEWLLSGRARQNVKVDLLGDSYVHPKLTILRFKEPDKIWSNNVVLLKDNIDENDFRRLRVRLNLSRGGVKNDI